MDGLPILQVIYYCAAGAGAIGAVYFAWRNLRSSHKANEPVYELTASWQARDLVRLHLVVRNRLASGLKLTGARITRPRLSRIALGYERTSDGTEVSSVPNARIVTFNHRLAAASADPTLARSQDVLEFFVSWPRWRFGNTITLEIQGERLEQPPRRFRKCLSARPEGKRP